MTISIIVVSKNSEKTIGECLKRLRAQSYDQSLMEILIVDGGSTDNSTEIASNYGAKIIDGGYPDNQEARRYIGGRAAKGKILLYLDTDNYIPHEKWLEKMLEPFIKSHVSASFTRWYEPSLMLPAIDRYYALLGGNDPIAFCLGKHDRVPFGDYSLPAGAKLQTRAENYDVVTFSLSNLPTLGCNGFLLRKECFDLLEIKDPEFFFHTDIHVDLIQINVEISYAIVNDSIIHASGGSLLNNQLKRVKYKFLLYDRLSSYRRYKVFDSKSVVDLIKLSYTIISAFTFVIPLLRAFYWFTKTNRWEWFFHPVALLSSVVMYSFGLIKRN